jgi:SAM-dependent methyltransferase
MTKNYSESLNPLGYYEAIPKPTSKELEQHYGEKYYQNAQGSYSSQYLDEELKYFHNVARVALETAGIFNLDKSLYDLGCGEGFFTKSFYDFGWKVSCCDFSAFGISKHNEEMLPYFSSGDIFEQVKDKIRNKKKYGLINLQNILEHVIDPVDLLIELKAMLSEKSAIRIRIPNDYSDFQKALFARNNTTNTWFSPPEHLSYFNKDGLTNILHHCGYKILSMQADFPIEIFLANNHSNYSKDRSLGKQAHLSRVFCENHLIETNITDYLEYSQAAGKLGFGRELITYAVVDQT